MSLRQSKWVAFSHLLGVLIKKGIPRYRAALQAAKHLTEAGYPIELVAADTGTNKDFAMKAATELVDKGNVDVLIGAASSTATIAVAEQVSIPKQVPQISYSSTSPRLTDLEADKDHNFLFRTTPSDTLQAKVLARLAFDKGYRHVSVFYIEGAYGKDFNQLFRNNFEELGRNNGEMVTVSPASHPEIPVSEFGDEEAVKNSLWNSLQQIRDGQTEVLIAISQPKYANIFLKQAIEDDKLPNEFLFVDATREQQIVEKVGAENLDGMCGTAPGVDKTTKSWEEF